MFKKILVPLDGSKRAEKILPHVEDLAHRYSKSQVVLLQVVEPIPVSVNLGDYVPPLEKKEIDGEFKVARAYLERLRARLLRKGILSRMHVLLGPVVPTISPRGRKWTCLLLPVMGEADCLLSSMGVSPQGYCIELIVHCSSFDLCNPE